MKKEFEKEQKDNQIDDAFLDMPDMDDDEKFSQWLEDEYLKEADAIEESLFAGRKFEDNQDIAEKLSVPRESFCQRMREEGMLDEEDSEEIVKMPAGEEAENKILEFKKDSETSKEDSDSEAKVVSIEKKSSVKKKHSYVRFGRIAGIAGLCLICVFAASMSSEANRKYLVNSVRILSGNDSQLISYNDETNETASTEESDAIADIEEKLDVKMPEFYYRPYGMEFYGYEVNKNSYFAKIEYKYEDNIIIFYVDKHNDGASSDISSLNGNEKQIDEILKDEFSVFIKESEDKNDKIPTYMANWSQGDVSYQLVGKISLKELEKIIKEMKF